MTRLGGHERSRGRFTWPLGYVLGLLAVGYFGVRGKVSADDDLACFGWQCVAIKNKC